MDIGGRRVLICDCEASMPLDGGKLTRACHAAGATGDLTLNTQLCRAQLANFQDALGDGKPLLVACTQEAPLFGEIAAEGMADDATDDADAPDIAYTNIRERAGWADQADAAIPKIAALIAEATLEIEPTPTVALASQGVCLIHGPGASALDAARQLAGRLDATVLVTDGDDVLPPAIMDVPIFRGTISQAGGHLGAFRVTVDGYAPAAPSSRGALAFEAPRDGAISECDLILDLTGGTPLFPAHEKRDGYLRPDPGDPLAVQKAIFAIADMVGDYEKPRYVRYDSEICTHARSGKVGCTRCLDVCPASAIVPAGDGVEIDPYLCGGCGACASVCPTGAATYQLPAGDAILRRARTLLGAYLAAGGAAPVVLVHDTRHGTEMIDAMERAGRGLPAAVLPFPVNEVTQIGLDFLAAALAYGATHIAILVDPRKRDELAGLAAQIGLVETVMEGLGYGGGRVHVPDAADPDAIEAALHDLPSDATAVPAGSFLPAGSKRARTLLALGHLHDHAPRRLESLPLPVGAPFGAVRVDIQGCTLCLACVGACPTGALRDDPDRPWLGFAEDACVQCGLCRETCPESVITLEPRLNFTESARGAIALNEQEPFECIRCGKPFGVRATIEHITEKLAGQNAMFASEAQIARLKMCDDCRVIVQFEAPDDPFKGAPRPVPRSTDDDLREREIEEARQKVLRERAASERGGES